MVDTIKFSQMPSGGDLANNEMTPGLQSGTNVLFNNPWTFLAPGSTAQRPTPSAAINYRLRFNTDDQLYEYYDATLSMWTQIEQSAFTVGPFITYTADASIPDAQNLGLLANGILKQTITTGVATLNIAVNGTDYYGPGFIVRPADGGTGINNGALTINLGSATTGFVLTSDSSGNATWQSVSASGGITTIDGNSGSATPLVGVVTITGASTGLTFTGASHTLSLGGLLTSTFGGLGVSNPTAHGILVGEGASAVNPIVLTSGQILIGSTGADPVAAAINSGTGILVGNGAGSITVSLAAIATLTGLVNTTGGSAAPVATTLSAWMDAALGSTQGDILYRNATVWTVLAPSTAGFSLQSGGAAANPAYSNTFTSSTLVTPATLGVQQQALNMNTHLINNVVDPVSAQDAATKNYVDQNALNGTSVYAASTGTLGTVTQSGAGIGATITNAGAQATFALDSVNPPVGTNVLIKNTSTGATAANEGVYSVTDVGSGSTNWVLTRATNFDTASEINTTGLIVIQNGATLAGTAWYNAATIVTVDTTAFSFSEFGNIIFPISLAHGGTNNNLTASAGGIVWSDASKLNILAGTSTANQIFLSGNAATPSWSTTTYPSTNAINTIMYASSANVLGVITPVNSAVLISSGAGVPSMSTTLPSGLTIPSPKITTGIFDSNGNEILAISPVASAVNYLSISNAATNNAVAISPVGSDPAIILTVSGKGTGGVQTQGNANASNASAGFVGEYVTSNIPAASAITLVASTPTDVTSISLTAGDYDVVGNVTFGPTGIIETLVGWISLTSATAPDGSNIALTLTAAAANGIGFCVPMLRVNVSSTTTVYLSAQSSSTPTVSGTIQARRRR